MVKGLSTEILFAALGAAGSAAVIRDEYVPRRAKRDLEPPPEIDTQEPKKLSRQQRRYNARKGYRGW